mmetsp:Transcript_8730/g.27845  ORF Transcript_8730/g.27845 Transcript_8730/m.27845 type:complete len:314 (+) Transcript_8730:650-1591(+)
MIVRQSQVHHWANDHLTVDRNGAILDRVHAEDGRLGRVENGRTHEGAKDTSVGDGEGTSRHLVQAKRAVASLGRERREGRLRLCNGQRFGVADDRHNEARRRRNGHRNVDVVTVDNLVALNDGVHHRRVDQRASARLHKGTHEAELGAISLGKRLLLAGTQGNECGHVHLVEGGQHRRGVLCLLHPLRNANSDLLHLLTTLSARPRQGGGRSGRGRSGRRRRGGRSSTGCGRRRGGRRRRRTSRGCAGSRGRRRRRRSSARRGLSGRRRRRRRRGGGSRRRRRRRLFLLLLGRGLLGATRSAAHRHGVQVSAN